jgi:O-antigen ligase
MTSVVPTTVAASPRRKAEAITGAERVGHVLALTTLAVAPLFLVVSGDPSTWKRGVILQLVDVLLVALLATRASTLLTRVRVERSGVTTAMIALLCALSVSLAIHPAMTGLMTVTRFGGAIALVDVLSHSPTAMRSSAAKIWLGWSVVEAAVAVGQKSLSRAIGVPGEVGIPFELLGSFSVPTGTSYGPHPIAAMGLVAIGLGVFGSHHRLVSRRWACAGSAGGAVIVGITCGTAGALSLAALLIASVVALARQPTARSNVGPVLAVVVVGFAFAAATSIDGWRFKAERTATTDVAAASNGRAGMIDESLAMIRRWPVLGVGPGRFLATRDAHPDIAAKASEDQAVHNVALLIVTESGVLGALALGGIAFAVFRRVRRRPFAPALLAAMLGHALFDHAPWTFGFGMVQLALVLGFATFVDP